MGCLYEISFPNGKRYLGITTVTLARRMTVHRSHARLGRRGAIYGALRKYGTAAMARQLVVSNDRKYLTELEKNAIRVFGTQVPKGYNLTSGGDGVAGYRWTPEQKLAQSRARKGVPTGVSPMRGRIHSPEARAKISAALRHQHASGARK